MVEQVTFDYIIEQIKYPLSDIRGNFSRHGGGETVSFSFNHEQYRVEKVFDFEGIDVTGCSYYIAEGLKILNSEESKHLLEMLKNHPRIKNDPLTSKQRLERIKQYKWTKFLTLSDSQEYQDELGEEQFENEYQNK